MNNSKFLTKVGKACFAITIIDTIASIILIATKIVSWVYMFNVIIILLMAFVIYIALSTIDKHTEDLNRLHAALGAINASIERINKSKSCDKNYSSIKEGDVIRFKKYIYFNEVDRSVNKGERGIVIRIEGNFATVKCGNGYLSFDVVVNIKELEK